MINSDYSKFIEATKSFQVEISSWVFKLKFKLKVTWTGMAGATTSSSNGIIFGGISFSVGTWSGSVGVLGTFNLKFTFNLKISDSLLNFQKSNISLRKNPRRLFQLELSTWTVQLRLSTWIFNLKSTWEYLWRQRKTRSKFWLVFLFQFLFALKILRK